MSLNSTKQSVKDQVKQLHEDMLTREVISTEEYADRLIDALEEWLKSATIKYIAGLTAPNGAVAGTFNGNLE